MAKFGVSVLVPCVQELAKNPIAVVPSKYIQSEQEAAVISNDDLISEIPVIDMECLLSEEFENSELAKLDFACKELGFFQLVNHEVGSSFLDKMKKEILEFFDPNMEEKKNYCQYPGEVEGFGQAFVASEEHRLDWEDVTFQSTLPVHLRKPNSFPKLPLPLRDTLEVYSLELQTLFMTLTLKMAKVLNIKDEEMREFFENGLQSMRMNYYPPSPQPEKFIALTPHSDGSGITILLQINEVEGLQIKKDGKWITVTPVLPNAFIVNIGDMMEVISNGIYHSIEHRATVHPTRERLSIATFYTPKYDCEIHPACSLISENTPPLFRTITVEGYIRGQFAREVGKKSSLDLLRIEHKPN